MAGTVVATLAVLGLAYSFGVGRGLIDRYQVARQALGRAELVIDSLTTLPRSAIVAGSQPFWVEGPSTAAGTTSWTLTNVDDPIDGTATSSPADPNPVDLRRIVVRVGWSLGGLSDTLSISRLVTVQ